MLEMFMQKIGDVEPERGMFEALTQFHAASFCLPLSIETLPQCRIVHTSSIMLGRRRTAKATLFQSDVVYVLMGGFVGFDGLGHLQCSV